MYIYNETKLPYSVKKDGDVGIIFRRSSKGKTGDVNKQFKTKKVHVLVHETVLTPETEENVNKAVLTKEPIQVSNKPSVLYFSKKELSPFITSLSSDRSTRLMATISLKGNRRIVSIDNPHVLLLKGYIMGGELTLIASFVDRSQDLTITFVENKKLIKYIFSHSKGEITLKVTEEDNVNNIKPERGFKINTYIPTRMTYCVLCHKKDREALETIIPEEKRKQYKIVEFTNKTIEEELIHLKQENYSAITVFINKPELDDEAQKIYHRSITLSQKRLRVVMLAFNNGEIKKIKY